MKFFTTSVDDWLDEKRKLDGAEGLWRIHDKLYDLTIWARIHTGGQFWINTTRGTDITEAYENHHFSTKSESLLQNYYRKEVASPSNSFTTFMENGFFKKFKRTALQKYPAANTKPSLLLMSDALAAAVFLTGFMGVSGGIAWKIASGVLLGLLAISSHGLLHSKQNWRVYYFHLSLMSSRECRIRHVLSHHQFRGTVFDLEVLVWQQFTKTHCGLPKYLLNLLLFPVAAHLQFIKKFPLFLFLFGGARQWGTFITWNHIILIASFVYCFFSSTSDRRHPPIISERSTQEIGHKDFGTVQLSLIGNHPKQKESVLSFLNSYRENVLHYLCPSVDCGSLQKHIPAFVEVSKECISLSETSNPFPEIIQKAAPEGHVSFS